MLEARNKIRKCLDRCPSKETNWSKHFHESFDKFKEKLRTRIKLFAIRNKIEPTSAQNITKFLEYICWSTDLFKDEFFR